MKNKIFSTISILIIALTTLFTTGCSFTALDGDWDEMEWQKVVPGKTKIDGIAHYDVSAEGGIYTFKCKNYNGFWLSHIAIKDDCRKSDEKIINPHPVNAFSNDWLDISISGSLMTVRFAPNDTISRTAEINVTAGDIFDTFHFIQRGTEKQ